MNNQPSERPAWAAVSSLALCVALLIAAEFMPVSLLTPIAQDLHATEGMAGQAISISGFCAVAMSLYIATIAGRFDRRYVLLALSGVMLISLIIIAVANNFLILMIARALLGLVIGGFWSLATATVMRLVPPGDVPKALGIVYTGNAVATAFAAPIGSYLGALIGWRGVFWALVPIAVLSIAWQLISLPAMPPGAITDNPINTMLRLLRRRHVAFGLSAVMLTFAGAFAAFTYFRPFLETYAHVTPVQFSLLLLGMGLAGFVGTYAATALVQRYTFALLAGLPVALSIVTIVLVTVRYQLPAIMPTMIAWGAINAAIPVCWSTWLSRGIQDEPESGGGLLVGAIQLSIMLGSFFGGILLDHVSVASTLIGGAVLLIGAGVIVGNGKRIQSLKPVG